MSQRSSEKHDRKANRVSRSSYTKRRLSSRQIGWQMKCEWKKRRRKKRSRDVDKPQTKWKVRFLGSKERKYSRLKCTMNDASNTLNKAMTIKIVKVWCVKPLEEFLCYRVRNIRHYKNIKCLHSLIRVFGFFSSLSRFNNVDVFMNIFYTNHANLMSEILIRFLIATQMRRRLRRRSLKQRKLT